MGKTFLRWTIVNLEIGMKRYKQTKSDIELEIPCPECLGKGCLEYVAVEHLPEICPHCDGEGVILATLYTD